MGRRGSQWGGARGSDGNRKIVRMAPSDLDRNGGGPFVAAGDCRQPASGRIGQRDASAAGVAALFTADAGRHAVSRLWHDDRMVALRPGALEAELADAAGRLPAGGLRHGLGGDGGVDGGAGFSAVGADAAGVRRGDPADRSHQPDSLGADRFSLKRSAGSCGWGNAELPGAF